MSKPKYLKPSQVITAAALSVVAGATSANAIGNVPSSRLDQIKVLQEDPAPANTVPLVLHPSAQSQFGLRYAGHYSHYSSHSSHYSGSGHYSHASHVSHGSHVSHQSSGY